MTKNTVARRYAKALFNLIEPSDRGKAKEALHAMALAMKRVGFPETCHCLPGLYP